MMQSLNHNSWFIKVGIIPQVVILSENWLRTCAVIHVNKASARWNGYRMFISIFYCDMYDGPNGSLFHFSDNSQF